MFHMYLRSLFDLEKNKISRVIQNLYKFVYLRISITLKHIFMVNYPLAVHYMNKVMVCTSRGDVVSSTYKSFVNSIFI